MFDTLSDRLGTALGDLRKGGRLDEESISRAMREIRLALIEADVNLEVVNDFVARVRERALDEEIAKGLNAGPAGREDRPRGADRAPRLGDRRARARSARRSSCSPASRAPARRRPPRSSRAAQGQRPQARADRRRPPASRPRSTSSSSSAGRSTSRLPIGHDRSGRGRRAGLERARADGLDTIIVDTAGRIQVDEDADGGARRASATRPSRPTSLLVLDAMTGQQAVAVAIAFQERIDIDGVVLTKLDGDARGGAALSVKSVTGRPIMFASTGEKLDALEVFHPERMASRILGMGDVLTLIERAEQADLEDEAAEMEARMRKGQFTFDDFLCARRRCSAGWARSRACMKLIPGMSQLADADIDESRMKRVEAVVLSMTPRERSMPHTIDGKRRLRIANGSGNDRPGRQPAPRGPQDDGEDDGPDGEGEDARDPRDGRADRRPGAPGRRARAWRRSSAVRRREETEGQQEAVRSSVT